MKDGLVHSAFMAIGAACFWLGAMAHGCAAGNTGIDLAKPDESQTDQVQGVEAGEDAQL